jgi:hypothetical protein
MALIDVASASEFHASWAKTLRSRSKTKSSRLKVPAERADLSHTGTSGIFLRSPSYLSSLTAP